jgi:hypothetical protein
MNISKIRNGNDYNRNVFNMTFDACRVAANGNFMIAAFLGNYKKFADYDFKCPYEKVWDANKDIQLNLLRIFLEPSPPFDQL